MKNTTSKVKIAIKAGTVDGDLFKQLMQAGATFQKYVIEPGITAYVMNDGTLVEVYGAGAGYPPYLFAHGNVVVNYKVNDIEETVLSLEKKGAKLLGKVENICSSYQYCHLLTHDKTVIGIYEYSQAQ